MDNAQNDDLASLRAALEARNRQVGAVHAIARLMSSTIDLDERLQILLAESMKASGAEAGSILLYRPADQKLVFQHVVGPRPGELTGFAMPASDGVAGKVFQSGQACIENDAEQSGVHRSDVSLRVGLVAKSILTVPLMNREMPPVGVVQLVNGAGGAFRKDDLELMEIVATMAATAILTSQRHVSSQLEAVGYAIADMSLHIRNKVTPISVASATLDSMFGEMLTDVDAALTEAPPALAARLSRAVQPMREFFPESHQITLAQVQDIQEYVKVVSDALQGIVSEPRLEPHELARVVERQLVALEETARKAGVRLARDLQPVPKCRIDRAQIESAVYQLVGNAISMTPSGGCVTVSTTSGPPGKFPAGSYAMVTITDTGCGMSAHTLQAVLAGEARSGRPGRAGLGTRIAHHAVVAHRALLEGESEEGKGTTLRLKLPMRGMGLVTPPPGVG